MGESFTHLVVCNFGFLESSDETCNFVKFFAVGTSSVDRASGTIIRFHNGLWSGDFGTLNPCLFPCGSGGGEIFSLCNPRLFVGFGDRFRRFPRAVWGKVKRAHSIMFMKVVISMGSNLRIVIGNNLPRA